MAVTDEELKGVSSDRLLNELNRRGYIKELIVPIAEHIEERIAEDSGPEVYYGASSVLDAINSALGLVEVAHG